MQSWESVAERLYSVRNPGGVALDAANAEAICARIAAGEIDLEATASIAGEERFLPITQFPRFAKAFEARFGIASRAAGSDSTPRSPGRSGNTPISLSSNNTPASNLANTPGPAQPEDPHTLRFVPSGSLLELARPPAPELRDSAVFKPQELDAWTPMSSPANAALPPEAPEPVMPVSLAGDLSPPSLAALPPDPPAMPDTRIDPFPAGKRAEAEDPQTPLTHTAPMLSSPAFEAHPSGDLDPQTPITLSGVATAADHRAQVIVGDLVEEPAEEPVVHPAASLRPSIPPPHTTLPPRMISELMRPSPVIIQVPPQLLKPALTPNALAYALAVWAVLFLVFYGAGIALELGNEEARWIPTGYYWARILLLISAGVGMSTWLLKDELVGASRFMVSAKWTAIALALGLFAGLISPVQAFGAGLPVALSMGFLQVVSEEIFFRGYVDRALVRSVPGALIPTAIAAVMYGCFQLTYSTLWLDRSLSEVLLYTATAIVALGAPLSFLHHQTRGFVAPFVCHVAAMMMMLLGTS